MTSVPSLPAKCKLFECWDPRVPRSVLGTGRLYLTIFYFSELFSRNHWNELLASWGCPLVSVGLSRQKLELRPPLGHSPSVSRGAAKGDTYRYLCTGTCFPRQSGSSSLRTAQRLTRCLSGGSPSCIHSLTWFPSCMQGLWKWHVWYLEGCHRTILQRKKKHIGSSRISGHVLTSFSQVAISSHIPALCLVKDLWVAHSFLETNWDCCHRPIETFVSETAQNVPSPSSSPNYNIFQDTWIEMIGVLIWICLVLGK